MLASIHPLGERARSQRFSVTVVALTIGSIGGGAIFGALLGALGSFISGSGSVALRAGVLAVAAVVGAIIDGRTRRVPSWHRQVNEDWLGRYRGWVYGFGFGTQLGVGVLTIVTTAAVYLTWVAAAATASPGLGLVVGASFGFARSVPLLGSASLVTPGAIAARVGRFEGWNGTFGTVTVWVEVMAACVAVLVVVSR
ncbi:MAG: hypothetical protein ABIP21_00610 [Acidimicrobiia bacterium]